MALPERVGRYRIERRLGAGAFATVWLASDDLLESQVAIKVLAENWAGHADVRARFEQDAQILRRADSERLVRIHDFGELPDGRPYQVMTYAAGGTLAERLAAGPISVRVALRTAAAIARATTDLHDAGVLHRDLKPSNVLFGTVRGVERVLVADLGLAKAIAYASGFTVVAGTPGYMAPEQSQPGGGLDVRADVHAIGAMAYQMLTSRTPARFAGLPVAVAGLALLSAAAPANPTPPGWARVSDATGAVSVAVPAGWAGQVRDGGWDPAAVGLPAGHAPGLTVTADPATATEEYAGGPLVFAGTAAGLGTAVLPAHVRCARQPDRTVEVAGRAGRVTRWTGCAGTAVSYSEVRLGEFYVQVKENGGADRTDEILGTLHS